MPLDITNILSSTNVAATRVGETTAALQKNDLTAQALEDANASVFNSVAANNSIIEDAKQAAALSTQAAKLKVANTFGVNMEDQGAQVYKLSQIAQQEWNNKEASFQKIKEKQSIGLLDNPIEWILNHLTINDDIDSYNLSEERMKSAEEQILKLNSLAQAQNVTQSQIEQSVTQASAEASVKNAAAKATIEANNATIAGIANNSAAIKQAANADEKLLQLKFNAFNAQKAEEANKLAYAHLALARQEREARIAKEKQSDENDAYLLGQLNLGSKILKGPGAPDIMVGTPKAREILANMRSGSELGKEYLAYYHAAQDSLTIDPSGQTRIISPTPSGAIEVLKRIPNTYITEAQKPVIGLLDQARSDIIARAQAHPELYKNKDALYVDIDNRAKELMAEYSKNVTSNPEVNPFALPDLSTVIKANPNVAKLPIVTQVIGPALASKYDMSTPDKAFQLVMQGVKEGKISIEQIPQLSTLFQAAQGLNYAARGFKSVGLIPDNTVNARITVNSNGVFGKSKMVDYTDPNKLSAAANSWIASHADVGIGGELYYTAQDYLKP